MIADVQHISFDLWLTLIRSNPKFKTERANLFREHFGLDHIGTDRILSVFTEFDRVFTRMNEITGGNLLPEEMYLLILERLGVSLGEIKTGDVLLFSNRSQELFVELPPVFLDEKIPEILNDMKSKGKSLSILSNTGFIVGRSLRYFLKKNCGEIFDFQLYSDEMGYSKPNRKVFEYLISHVKQLKDENIPSSAILHVGDNPVADFAGASTCGIKPFLLKHSENNFTSIQSVYETVLC